MTTNRSEILNYWLGFRTREPLVSSKLIDLAWEICQHNSVEASLKAECFCAILAVLSKYDTELGLPKKATDADLLNWAVTIGFYELQESVSRE